MSDVQWLFAVLAALYLWECAGWLRRGGMAFTRGWSRRWSVQHPARLMGNQNGGFVFAPPLPPLHPVYHSSQLPVSIGPAGVLGYVATNLNPGWRPAQSGIFLAWPEVGTLTASGKNLRHGKRIFVSAATRWRAEQWLISLQRLAALSSAQRPAAIEEFLQTAFDFNQALARRQQCEPALHRLQRWSTGVIGLVFLVAPLAVATAGLGIVWLPLLLALLALNFGTAVQFARAHREFFPAAEEERFSHTLLVALAPATTMRAPDYLSRAVLEQFHPLTVGGLLLTPEQFHRFARRILIELRHPALPHCPLSRPEAIDTESFHRRTQLRLAEAALRSRGFNPDELTCPPAATERANRAYCPRCESQFVTATGTCSDCGGLALVPFPNES